MKCAGCGVKLQTTDETKDGYVKEIHLIENGEQVYCKRCFDIIHYNRRYTPSDDNELFIKKMQNVKNKYPHDCICLMIDAQDILGTFIDFFDDIVGKLKVIILINRIDVLPKSIKAEHLENVVRNMALNRGLNVVAIYSICAKKEQDVERVLHKIDHLRQNRFKNKPLFNNCFVIGVASVGKSTFINSVMKICKLNSLPITTSDQFQTTLDLIKIELGHKFFIYDTPGVVNDHSFKHYLCYESVKKATPRSYLKVRTYQLQSGQTMFIGGMVRLDFVSGEDISVSFFISNDLYIHRTKLENADKIYEQHKNSLLSPPNDDEQDKLGIFHDTSFQIIDDKFYDLMISGLGFVHLRGHNVVINMQMSKKIDFKFCETIL